MRLFFVSIKRKSNSRRLLPSFVESGSDRNFFVLLNRTLRCFCCHKRILGRCNDRSVGIKDRLVIVEKDAHMASFIFNNQCVDGPRFFPRLHFQRFRLRLMLL